MQGAVAALAGTPGDAAVSYGHLHLPSRDETAVGGIVKLQSLSEEFPNSPLRFDVLYLVSSNLPEGAVTLARWARRSGARVVINQNGVAYPAWHGPGWERVNAPMRELLSLANYVFYQSDFCRRSADKFAGPPAGAYEILHNAVDIEVFSPSREAGAPKTLLLAGSQDAWYRYAAAVDTLAALTQTGSDYRLIVTGRLGWTADRLDARSRADAYARERGVLERIEFVGPYTQRQAPEIYRRADILIHTKYNDPCPAVVVEAMACGLPVAYSATGGVPELVGDAGVGVPDVENWDRDLPPDPQKLAEAVREVAVHHGSFSSRARQRAVDHLNVRSWLARHRAVFAQ
ncbi:MAG TPA: glycosyltransferase family 4 protein [Vicinamibacterales bacterium]|nr:glycosyltransferase family 4 protein [Vicinamibacterales bacterium]